MDTSDIHQGAVTSEKIKDGTIKVGDLTFDPATQSELDALSASDGSGPNSGANKVHWNILNGVPAGFADGVDDVGGGGPAADVQCTGCVQSSDIEDTTIAVGDLAFDPATQAELDGLATSDGNGPNTGSNKVHWDNLNGVPADFADGTDNVDGGTAADLNCNGCLTADDLGTGSVGTDEVALNSLTADDLATGSVTSDEIANGTITADDVAAGAILTSKLTANVGTGSGGPTNVVGTPTTVASVIITNPDTQNHALLLTGQVQLTCTGSCGGSVLWAVYEGATQVGLAYSSSTQSGLLTGSVSFSNPASGPATHTYDLKVTNPLAPSAVITAFNGQLTAADLGRL